MEYLNLNHLKYFYTVAKFKSYSKASAHLHIQQPALSKSVKSLEETLGTKLFARKGRGIELTSGAQYIYSRCDEIFSQVDQIVHYSKDQDLPLRESKTFYVPDILTLELMPNAIMNLRETYPEVRPIIVTTTAAAALEQMSQGKSNLGLFFHLPELPPELVIKQKIPLSHKLVISAKEYNSQKVRASFIGSREVDGPGTKSFPTVEKLRGICPGAQIKISCNNLVTHKELVHRGAGVSILPEFFVKEELRSGEFKALLEEENFVFNLKVVTPRNVKLEHYETSLLSEVIDSLPHAQ